MTEISSVHQQGEGVATKQPQSLSLRSTDWMLRRDVRRVDFLLRDTETIQRRMEERRKNAQLRAESAKTVAEAKKLNRRAHMQEWYTRKERLSSRDYGLLGIIAGTGVFSSVVLSGIAINGIVGSKVIAGEVANWFFAVGAIGMLAVIAIGKFYADYVEKAKAATEENQQQPASRTEAMASPA
jgi:hypothetical protein